MWIEIGQSEKSFALFLTHFTSKKIVRKIGNITKRLGSGLRFDFRARLKNRVMVRVWLRV